VASCGVWRQDAAACLSLLPWLPTKLTHQADKCIGLKSNKERVRVIYSAHGKPLSLTALKLLDTAAAV